MTDSDVADAPEPFWRPTTRLNRIVEGGLRRLPLRSLSRADIEQLQQRSIDTFVVLGASGDVLRRAISESEWRISDARAPADAWGGEVLQQAAGPPLVVFYRDSPLTRLHGPVYRIAAQLAVDHMLAHLYEYYDGAEDWGEEVATRWQFRLLRARGGMVNNFTAVVMALTSRFHKQIPLSTYG